jgi:hypothetical protein
MTAVRAAIGSVLIRLGIRLIPEDAWIVVTSEESETSSSAITQLYWRSDS